MYESLTPQEIHEGYEKVRAKCLAIYEEAMAKADEMACYTQQNIRIYADEKRDMLVAGRCWYGVEPDDECSEGDIISFGKFGHYDEWYIL